MVLVSAFMLAADSKPNFTGTWELNLQKSDLGGVPITKLVVQVEHKDPVLKYTATGTAGGEDFTEVENLSTDGKPTANSQGTVKAYWDGTILVVETTGPDGQPVDASRLALSPDGKTMTREYERKTADPQKRHDVYDKR